MLYFIQAVVVKSASFHQLQVTLNKKVDRLLIFVVVLTIKRQFTVPKKSFKKM